MKQKIKPEQISFQKVPSSFGNFNKQKMHVSEKIVEGDSQKAIRQLVKRHPFNDGIFATK